MKTLQAVWDAHFQPLADKASLSAQERSALYASVKGTLTWAGWATPTGDMSFLSDNDVNAALIAARQAFDTAMTRLQNLRDEQRHLAAHADGMSPSLSTVSASVGVATLYAPGSTALQAGMPVLATIGDKCNRCSAAMRPVALVNGQRGLLCLSGDHVVLPLAP